MEVDSRRRKGGRCPLTETGLVKQIFLYVPDLLGSCRFAGDIGSTSQFSYQIITNRLPGGLTTHTFVLLSNAFESLARSAKATEDYVLHMTVPVAFARPRRAELHEGAT